MSKELYDDLDNKGIKLKSPSLSKEIFDESDEDNSDDIIPLPNIGDEIFIDTSAGEFQFNKLYKVHDVIDDEDLISVIDDNGDEIYLLMDEYYSSNHRDLE